MVYQSALPGLKIFIGCPDPDNNQVDEHTIEHTIEQPNSASKLRFMNRTESHDVP